MRMSEQVSLLTVRPLQMTTATVDHQDQDQWRWNAPALQCTADCTTAPTIDSGTFSGDESVALCTESSSIIELANSVLVSCSQTAGENVRQTHSRHRQTSKRSKKARAERRAHSPAATGVPTTKATTTRDFHTINLTAPTARQVQTAARDSTTAAAAFPSCSSSRSLAHMSINVANYGKTKVVEAAQSEAVKLNDGSFKAQASERANNNDNNDDDVHFCARHSSCANSVCWRQASQRQRQFYDDDQYYQDKDYKDKVGLTYDETHSQVFFSLKPPTEVTTTTSVELVAPIAHATGAQTNNHEQQQQQQQLDLGSCCCCMQRQQSTENYNRSQHIDIEAAAAAAPTVPTAPTMAGIAQLNPVSSALSSSRQRQQKQANKSQQTSCLRSPSVSSSNSNKFAAIARPLTGIVGIKNNNNEQQQQKQRHQDHNCGHQLWAAKTQQSKQHQVDSIGRQSSSSIVVSRYDIDTNSDITSSDTNHVIIDADADHNHSTIDAKLRDCTEINIDESSESGTFPLDRALASCGRRCCCCCSETKSSTSATNEQTQDQSSSSPSSWRTKDKHHNRRQEINHQGVRSTSFFAGLFRYSSSLSAFSSPLLSSKSKLSERYKSSLIGTNKVNVNPSIKCNNNNNNNNSSSSKEANRLSLNNKQNHNCDMPIICEPQVNGTQSCAPVMLACQCRNNKASSPEQQQQQQHQYQGNDNNDDDYLLLDNNLNTDNQSDSNNNTGINQLSSSISINTADNHSIDSGTAMSTCEELTSISGHVNGNNSQSRPNQGQLLIPNTRANGPMGRRVTVANPPQLLSLDGNAAPPVDESRRSLSGALSAGPTTPASEGLASVGSPTSDDHDSCASCSPFASLQTLDSGHTTMATTSITTKTDTTTIPAITTMTTITTGDNPENTQMHDVDSTNQSLLDVQHRHLHQRRPSRTEQRQSLSDLGYGKTESYVKLSKLGRGTYATVYQGRSRLSNELVALKEVLKEHDEGAPCTAIREVSLLRLLRHNNIVTLHDICHTPRKLTLVFEYVGQDLDAYMRDCNHVLAMHNVRLFMYQLLRGLAFCHARQVLHRDLKPQNLLINRRGELKICDFGLARSKSWFTKTYSKEVVTIWYRPPDVLLGNTDYDYSIDMWGVGCIFYEMASGRTFFPGSSVQQQLYLIFSSLGTPNKQLWPECLDNPEFQRYKFPAFRPERLINRVPRLDPDGMALMLKFLKYRPSERITTDEARLDPFFASLPSDVHTLHELDSIFKVPGVHLTLNPGQKLNQI